MRRLGSLAAGLALICVSCTLQEPSSVNPDAPDVMTQSGPVEGALAGEAAIAWYAIPYARPPLGALRWQAPLPPLDWVEPLAKEAPGAPCAQSGVPDASGQASVRGSEDCLTLNIYAPEAAPDQPMPVMVWIHGGGNYAGAAEGYDGSELAARHGVVVITINYRLGPFGWFHHPAVLDDQGTSPATGQFAILDMVQALKWIQANVPAFGGDSKNITIFGESAGAQNVYALVFSPLTDGLFQKAIAQSGGFWNMAPAQAVNAHTEDPPGTPASASEIVADLLLRAGRANDRDEARKIAMSMPAADLADWLHGLGTDEILAAYAEQTDLGYDLPSVVLDGVAYPDTPYPDLLSEVSKPLVPMIVGGNRNEQKAWLPFDPDFVTWSGAAAEIMDRDRYEAFDQHYTDWWNFIAVDALADHYPNETYAYRFDWDDAPTTPQDLSFLFGAAHGMEIPFVFGDFQDNGFERLFTEENRAGREELSDVMMSYWAAFAHTGTPGRGIGGELPLWPDWSGSHKKMVFDEPGTSLQSSALNRTKLLDALLSDQRISDADRCNILRHNTMYPVYDRDRLADAGCRVND